MVQRFGTTRPWLVILASVFMTLLFVAGLAAGIYLGPRLMTSAASDPHGEHDDHESPAGIERHAEDEDHEDEDHDHDAEDHDQPEHEDEHLALTRQAFDNLGLELRQPTTGDYWKNVLVPAEVVEIPGRSDLSVSAPVTGVIERVDVLPGESLVADQAMFALRITDEALIDAQSKLLAALAREDVVRQEISRLEPIIRSGAVPGARKRELEYELRALVAEQQTLSQELRGRGLPDSMVQSVRNDRALATRIVVRPPLFVEAEDSESSAESGASQSSGYSVENLEAHPGKGVVRGDVLCTLAYHTELHVRGNAFASDLRTLNRIAENGWSITGEAPGEVGGDEHEELLSGLRLLRVDNHVDPQTQTVQFFVALNNEVDRSVEDREGRRFEQWRYRPGQRLHLRLPVERWTGQLTLPIDAVVIEGPNAWVFAEHHEPQAATDSVQQEAAREQSDQDDVFIELEPVPVRVLHRDDSVVVVEKELGLPAGTRIAMNHAHKLYLAMKIQAAGGGGHHHHHDH